jgi:uracil-DNA glycosylase
MTRDTKRASAAGLVGRAVRNRGPREDRASRARCGTLAEVVARARACTICAPHLPLGPNPVLRVHADARLLIVGQAPGTRVHATGTPWNDPSGDRLRDWLAVDRDTFYDERRIAILPTGLCYPGRGPSGDLPPRAECAPEWHPPILARLPRLELVLLVGAYAQAYYLGERCCESLTATVRAWREYGPRFLPLPHPSPRNIPWLRRNPWFDHDVVPALRAQVGTFVRGAREAPGQRPADR